MAAAQIKVGDYVGIYLGGATAHCAVAVSHVFGEVTAETEKAVEITAKRGKCWLPRRALIAPTTPPEMGGSYRLARWFKADGWCRRWMEMNVKHAVLAA